MIRIEMKKGHVALIDEIDADLASHRYWASINGPRHIYAQRQGAVRRKIYLHREIGERISGGPILPGFVVDHINGDTLNCTRENLRVVTHKRNIWNQKAPSKSRSGIIGVWQDSRTGRWRAYICEGHKHFALGSYATPEEAQAARRAAERAREARASDARS